MWVEVTHAGSPMLVNLDTGARITAGEGQSSLFLPDADRGFMVDQPYAIFRALLVGGDAGGAELARALWAAANCQEMLDDLREDHDQHGGLGPDDAERLLVLERVAATLGVEQ